MVVKKAQRTFFVSKERFLQIFFKFYYDYCVEKGVNYSNMDFNVDGSFFKNRWGGHFSSDGGVIKNI